MAGSRTLKLSILGDVDNLNKSLKTASTDVDSFGDKVGKAGLAIGKAFAAAAAAAGAAAIAIGIESVNAAIADEKAQTQLALALENATGATTAQIAATEQSILKMSLATGVADDQLRPALQRLVLSTGDITKAQDLLSVALDVSTATGKPLESVANALGRAYDGNTTALGKLGIGLSSAELKTMSFEEVQTRLSDLFGGAAAANAETYAGKIARVQVAFNEAKETLGNALLPILDKLLKFINDNALPAITAFSNAFSLTEGDGFGKVISDVAGVIKSLVQPIFEAFKNTFDKIKKTIIENKDEFASFFEVIKAAAPIIGKVVGAAFTVIGDIANVVLNIMANVVGALKGLINTAIDLINIAIKGFNLIKPGADIAPINKIGSGSTSTGALGNFSMSTGQTSTTPTINVPTGITGGSTGGGSTGGGLATAAAAAASAANNIVSGSFNAGRFRTAEAASMGTTINLTVTGAFEPEGTARTIIDTLNNSYYRGTGGGANLAGVA
jgi:phage-related protein